MTGSLFSKTADCFRQVRMRNYLILMVSSPNWLKERDKNDMYFNALPNFLWTSRRNKLKYILYIGPNIDYKSTYERIFSITSHFHNCYSLNSSYPSLNILTGSLSAILKVLWKFRPFYTFNVDLPLCKPWFQKFIQCT